MSFPAEVPDLRRREAISTLLSQPGEGRLGGGATGRAGARAHRGDDFRDIDLALRLYVFPQCCRARLFGVVGENVSIDDKSTGHGIDLLGIQPRQLAVSRISLSIGNCERHSGVVTGQSRS